MRTTARGEVRAVMALAVCLAVVSACTARPFAFASLAAPNRSLARVSGVLLLLGTSSGHADVYRVARDGRVQALTHLGGRAGGVSTLTSNARRIVVSDSRVDSVDHIDELGRGTLIDLRLGHTFTPGLSPGGALAWIALRHATPTDATPDAFVVVTRKGNARPRVVFSSPAATANPIWVGERTILVAVLGRQATAIDRVRLGRHPITTELATVPERRPGLGFTASRRYLTVGGAPAALLTSDGRPVATLGAGWQPLCWTATDTLLMTSGHRLGIERITPAGPRHVVDLGPVSTTLDVFGASCTAPH